MAILPLSIWRGNKRLPILAAGLLCLVAGAALLMILLEPDGERKLPPAQEDLSRHPVYSNYRFSPPEDTVRIGIQPFWTYGSNIAEAMRRDRLLRRELADLGMKAEFHSFLKGQDVNFFMGKGDLDVGMGGYLPTLRMTARQETLVPATIDRNFSDLVAVNCLTAADLEGKKIGFPPGSDAHHALVEALELMGIRARLVPIDIDGIPEALRTGRIDACMVWDPVTSLLLSENNNARVVYRSIWTTFLYFRGGFAKRHPRAVRSLLASQARAVRWIRLDPDHLELSSRWAVDACRRLAPDSPPLSPEVFVQESRKAAALSGTPVVHEGDLADGQYLSHAFAFLKREGMIPAGAEWHKAHAMFDTKLMRTILARPSRWRLDTFDYDAGEGRP